MLLAFAYQAGFFSHSGCRSPRGRRASRPNRSPLRIRRSPVSTSSNSPIPSPPNPPSRTRTFRTTSILNALSGNIRRSNGDTIDVKANNGLYDTDGKTLDLNGAVEIISEGKFIARMDKAHVIVKEKRLVANTPVTVEMPNGTIDAKALQITNDGNNILFFNGVHAKFKSNGAKGDTFP